MDTIDLTGTFRKPSGNATKRTQHVDQVLTSISRRHGQIQAGRKRRSAEFESDRDDMDIDMIQGDLPDSPPPAYSTVAPLQQKDDHTTGTQIAAPQALGEGLEQYFSESSAPLSAHPSRRGTIADSEEEDEPVFDARHADVFNSDNSATRKAQLDVRDEDIASVPLRSQIKESTKRQPPILAMGKNGQFSMKHSEKVLPHGSEERSCTHIGESQSVVQIFSLASDLHVKRHLQSIMDKLAKTAQEYRLVMVDDQSPRLTELNQRRSILRGQKKATEDLLAAQTKHRQLSQDLQSQTEKFDEDFGAEDDAFQSQLEELRRAQDAFRRSETRLDQLIHDSGFDVFNLPRIDSWDTTVPAAKTCTIGSASKSARSDPVLENAFDPEAIRQTQILTDTVNVPTRSTAGQSAVDRHLTNGPANDPTSLTNASSTFLRPTPPPPRVKYSRGSCNDQTRVKVPLNSTIHTCEPEYDLTTTPRSGSLMNVHDGYDYGGFADDADEMLHGDETGAVFEADDFMGEDDDAEMLEAANEIHYEPSVPSTFAPRKRAALSETSGNAQERPHPLSPATVKARKSETSARAELNSKPWAAEVRDAMFRRFKMTGFRLNQLEAINATLNKRDVFVLMPTGGGKSLCFQLPAIIKSAPTHGVTVVVSPLLR